MEGNELGSVRPAGPSTPNRTVAGTVATRVGVKPGAQRKESA